MSIKHLVSQDGLGVESGILPVAMHGAGAERPGLVFAQPLAQGHAAVLGKRHILIGFDALVELGQQFLLRSAVDIPKDGGAVALWPTTIVSQSPAV